MKPGIGIHLLSLTFAALALAACEPWVCDSTTCADGCCTAGGECVVQVLGQSDATCGLGGGACLNCTGVGTCFAGACRCTPGSCTGCCDSQYHCQAGTSNSQCGAGGSACTDCQGSGSTCVTDRYTLRGGTCQACSQSCSGCCTSQGICSSGDSDYSCGSGGSQCQSCSFDSHCYSGTCL